jgi:hypothetical protein
MRKFIGVTYHVGYFSTFTNINITQGTIKIYIVPNNMKGDPDNIDTTQLSNVFLDEMNCDVKYDIKYDASGYMNGNTNENFKLLVNGECVHASQYTMKYLIEFTGSFVLTDVSFVDH